MGMALLSATLGAKAQEFAKLPYQQLYHVRKVQGELTHTYTNLHVALRMQSTDIKVKTGDLDVFIDAKSGRIPVKIGEDGSFLIPMRDDLAEENPPVITNQPRGTMLLDWKVGLNASQMTNTMSYRRLMQPVKDCEAVQGKMREVFPGAPKLKMVGLKMIYDTIKNNPQVDIAAKKGGQKFKSNDDGEIMVPLDVALLEEDPSVSIPQLPAKVEIVSGKSED